VGVEEEFLLLWPDGRTADIAPALLGAVQAAVRAVPEFARCQVETSTGICTDLLTVARELSVARQVLARAGADRGARLVAVGTPPCGAPGPAQLTDDVRYRRLLATVPGVTGEEITCAGQVHVAVASRDLGAAVLARLRPWLPVLLAVAGNSPLWRGRDTGWSSHRFVVQRRWPSFLPPPSCPDAAAYDERVTDLLGSHAALDAQGVYFWARLSPRFPTVEIRIADTFLTVSDAVLLTALCRALVSTAAAEELAGHPVLDLPDRLVVAGAYGAARRGLAGTVVAPLRETWAPAGAVLRDLVGRLAPQLDAAGDRQLVRALLAARLRTGSGAARERAVWRPGDHPSSVQALADLTAGLGAGR